jgi:hypothetical protein
MRSPGIVKTAIWDDACKASGHCAEFVCGLRERHLHLFDGLFRNGIEAHNTLEQLAAEPDFYEML